VVKKPVSRFEPKPTKIPPKPGFDEDPRNLRPAWRISAMEMRDPFGWHHLDEGLLHYIRDKIRNFEALTWKEILVRDRHLNHRVETWNLCKDAQDRLRELALEDVEELVSLRLSATERIWGVLEHNVLSLLWWDPFHVVCPALKKHT
jgi:hypothetical protein